MSVDSSISEGAKLTLDIEKLVYGGDGFSHYQSQACFVKDVIPGEQVTATVEKVKRQYLLCVPCTIHTISPYRIQPVCHVIEDCGGCQWQHIDYHHQLYWKERILKESLTRIAGLSDTSIRSVIPSPLSFNYRSKATLKTGGREGNLIGYFKAKTHTIVPVKHCALLNPQLNSALNTCRERLDADVDFFRDISAIQMLFVHASGDILLSLKNRKTKRTAKYLLSDNSDVFAEYDGISLEKVHDISFKRDTESFYQINHEQNVQMIRCVLNYFAKLNDDTILDLYCGCGNFSLFLARQATRVIGVDTNRFAIEEARFNARSNSIDNCMFIQADINRIDDRILQGRFSGVLLNPPRSGCSREILEKISGKKPGTIVYVSCNPSTLARDLHILISSGYAIEEIQPFDMFPQTYHIETVVKLIK